MTNIMELKDLRTKEELVQYFKMLGTKITDEEIDKLKTSFEQAEQNSNNLTLQQLDSVAGGVVKGIVYIGANGTCSEHADFKMDKVTVAFNTRGKFDHYAFHNADGFHVD